MREYKNGLSPTSYIVPIFCNGVFNGTGFIIDKYLITAGHIVSYPKDLDTIWIKTNDKEISLNWPIERFHSRKILCTPDGINPYTGEDSGDLAVYDISHTDIYSPLVFAEEDIKFGAEENPIYENLFYQPSNNSYSFHQGQTKIVGPCEVRNHFFEGYALCTIKKGASGSPLLRDNVVYGMLTDGYNSNYINWAKSNGLNINQTVIEEAKNRVVFMKASSIKMAMRINGLL